jgi:hypothetical protein
VSSGVVPVGLGAAAAKVAVGMWTVMRASSWEQKANYVCQDGACRTAPPVLDLAAAKS